MPINTPVRRDFSNDQGVREPFLQHFQQPSLQDPRVFTGNLTQPREALPTNLGTVSQRSDGFNFGDRSVLGILGALLPGAVARVVSPEPSTTSSSTTSSSTTTNPGTSNTSGSADADGGTDGGDAGAGDVTSEDLRGLVVGSPEWQRILDILLEQQGLPTGDSPQVDPQDDPAGQGPGVFDDDNNPFPDPGGTGDPNTGTTGDITDDAVFPNGVNPNEQPPLETVIPQVGGTGGLNIPDFGGILSSIIDQFGLPSFEGDDTPEESTVDQDLDELLSGPLFFDEALGAIPAAGESTIGGVEPSISETGNISSSVSDSLGVSASDSLMGILGSLISTINFGSAGGGFLDVQIF